MVGNKFLNNILIMLRLQNAKITYDLMHNKHIKELLTNQILFWLANATRNRKLWIYATHI